MKGSTINREVMKNVKNKDLLITAEKGVLKDLDFIRLNEMNNFFNMGSKTLLLIHQQISIDVQYLQSQRFMDYSLLFSVRKVNSINLARKTTLDFDLIKNESESKLV
jgi:hypothetical protein